ncbi:MAG: hypothetical protein ACJ72D_30830 [Marmoricola sp.]
MTNPPTTTARRSRTTLAALVLTTAVAAVPTAAGAATTTADRTWSGYRTPTGSTAGSGWVGARRTDGQVVYRIDPGRRATRTSGFATPSWTGRLDGVGPHHPSSTDTARAAWILGKYGTYRYAVQDAAVEVAVDHLLYGGSWALSGTSTRARLKASGHGSAIRSFASRMLTDSSRYAGPYTIAVTPGPAAAGGTVTVRVRVTATRTGAPVEHLPVDVIYSGTARPRVETGADGSATTTAPAGTAGPHAVTATVGLLPQTQLLVRAPRTARASRVAVAGLKTSRTVVATAAVREGTTVTTTATRTPITTTESPAGRLEITGAYPSARTATASLYGPFATAPAVTCDPGNRVSSGTVQVAADGAYPLPDGLRVPGYGYYVWGVTVPADAYNAAASACSGTTLVLTAPTVTAAPTGASYRAGAFVHGLVRTAGLPSGYAGNATLQLYGPFTTAAAATCDPSRLAATQSVRVTANGTTPGPDRAVSALGWYVWVAGLPASGFSASAVSSCSAAGAKFQVTW